MSAKPTIAITGATGLVGGALARRFAGGGYPVVALVRRHDPALAAVPGVQVRECDLPDRIGAAVLSGVQVVIHAAYPTRLRDLEQIRRINETGTERLLELARRSGVEQFILVSTTSAHEEALSYYGQSKLRLERSLDPTRDLAIRLGLVLAPDGGLFCRIRDSIRRTRVVPVFGGGRQVIQTLHVEDLSDAFVATVERGMTGLVSVAEPDGLEFRDFLRLVARRLHRKVVLIPAPIAPMLYAMRAAEVLRIPLPVSAENLLGLKTLQRVECRADLEQLGIRVRPAAQSLQTLIPDERV